MTEGQWSVWVSIMDSYLVGSRENQISKKFSKGRLKYQKNMDPLFMYSESPLGTAALSPPA
jgi:hypothetical protein